MRKNRYIIWLIIAVFLVGFVYFIFINKENYRGQTEHIETESKVDTLSKYNIAKIKSKDNIIEIYQNFIKQNSADGEYISLVHDLDIINSSATMMSAYSLDNISSYKLFYRLYFDGKWEIWKSLDENTEEANPNRKIFGPIIIPNNIEKIQFKSTESTNSEVVFRFFIYNFMEI